MQSGIINVLYPEGYHAGNDEIFPVQLFFTLIMYNPSYILFIRQKVLSDRKIRDFSIESSII